MRIDTKNWLLDDDDDDDDDDHDDDDDDTSRVVPLCSRQGRAAGRVRSQHRPRAVDRVSWEVRVVLEGCIVAAGPNVGVGVEEGSGDGEDDDGEAASCSPPRPRRSSVCRCFRAFCSRMLVSASLGRTKLLLLLLLLL